MQNFEVEYDKVKSTSIISTIIVFVCVLGNLILLTKYKTAIENYELFLEIKMNP